MGFYRPSAAQSGSFGGCHRCDCGHPENTAGGAQQKMRRCFLRRQWRCRTGRDPERTGSDRDRHRKFLLRSDQCLCNGAGCRRGCDSGRYRCGKGCLGKGTSHPQNCLWNAGHHKRSGDDKGTGCRRNPLRHAAGEGSEKRRISPDRNR